MNKNQNKAVVWSYSQRKANARETAIDWQSDYCNHNYSYGELAMFSNYFTKLAKRFELVKKFKENGVI